MNDLQGHSHAHAHNLFTALWILTRTTRVSRLQKGKTNLDLLEQAGPYAYLYLDPDT